MELETLLKPTLLDATLRHLSRGDLPKVLQVQQGIIRATHNFMFKKGLIQLMPIMLSPITDPLNYSLRKCEDLPTFLVTLRLRLAAW